MDNFFSFACNPRIISVVCNQWGDTGKGKFSHLFGEWADVVVRGTGGANAGHTVIVGNKQIALHLIPASILYNNSDKISVLGNGMVIDPQALCHELDELAQAGFVEHSLLISHDAHLILPYHIKYDQAKNMSQSNGGVGSTGRGIGPCYADKVSRIGIKVGYLLYPELLLHKLSNPRLRQAYPGIEINPQKIVNWLKPFISQLAPYIVDTIDRIQTLVRQDKKILIEGAQGLLLSYEFGTYPYVTSSDCSANGTASGAGLFAKQVDLSFGIVKFPFMTRVGAGQFPTECGKVASEKYCSAGTAHDIFYEAKNFLGLDLPLVKIREAQANQKEYLVETYRRQVDQFLKDNHQKVLSLCNSKDEFIQGIGLRLIANEYGATTFRPRRTGYLDAVAAKYAVNINGPHMILTKLDCMAGVKEFKICYGYEIDGYLVTDFIRDPDVLKQVKPIYKTYAGYGDISHLRSYSELPSSLRQAIADFETFTSGQVHIISVGPKPEQTIAVN